MSRDLGVDSGTPPVASSIASVAAPSLSPPPTPPAATPDHCPAFQAATKRALGKYLGGADAGTTHIVGFCSGPWRIAMPDQSVLDEAKGARGDDALAYPLETEFAIEHVDAQGRVLRHVPTTKTQHYGYRIVTTPTVYDFDGDGSPEIYVEVREEGDEGHRALQNELLTFDGRAIVPYKPALAFSIDTLEDVDGDGRPDILTLSRYSDSLTACGSGFSYDFPKPKLVAHARADGRFDMRDAAARAYAKSWCPAAPSAISTSYDALCARLWATTPAELAASRKLARACTPLSCDLVLDNKPQAPSASEECERRIAWFDATPPFTF